MAMLKLSPSWDVHYQKIKALFEMDEEVTVVYDRDKIEVKLYVSNIEKAWALDKLIITDPQFGSVKMHVVVIPPNDSDYRLHNDLSDRELFEVAFRNNPLYFFSKTITIYGIYSNPITYVVFWPTVVQYYTDSLNDINGIASTLAQDIVKDVFNDIDGVFYCTDKISTGRVRAANKWDYANDRR